MLKIIGLLITLWPVIKPILPVILELVKKNKGLLSQMNERWDTTPTQDTRDFFQEIEKRKEWGDDYWKQLQEDGA